MLGSVWPSRRGSPASENLPQFLCPNVASDSVAGPNRRKYLSGSVGKLASASWCVLLTGRSLAVGGNIADAAEHSIPDRGKQSRRPRKSTFSSVDGQYRHRLEGWGSVKPVSPRRPVVTSIDSGTNSSVQISFRYLRPTPSTTISDWFRCEPPRISHPASPERSSPHASSPDGGRSRSQGSSRISATKCEPYSTNG